MKYSEQPYYDDETGFQIGFCKRDIQRALHVWHNAQNRSRVKVENMALAFNLQSQEVVELIGTENPFFYVVEEDAPMNDWLVEAEGL